MGCRQTQFQMEDDVEKSLDDEDELNVESANFNPLRTLYSKNVVVPFTSAPILDNVGKATSLLSRNQDLFSEAGYVSKSEVCPKSKLKEEVKPSTSKNMTENFGVHPESGIVFDSKKHVLLRMSETKGPLALLKMCMNKRIRIKVWTRSAREIRGYCLGFVLAFDKHWNLVLEDVQEVWSRRIKRKKFLLGKPNEMPLAWRAMGPAVKPPNVVVTKRSRSMETCERHVPKLLMRGEHIVFVSIPDT